MIGYQYIQDLFTSIFNLSNGIAGRFFVSARSGREINADELGQVIQDSFAGSQLPKKYPLALMLAPVSTGEYTNPQGEWDYYRVSIFFLNTTFYSGTNQVMKPNKATGTSTHTVLQDWHDMKRCAMGFIQALELVIKTNRLMATTIRLDREQPKIFTPVSFIGVDRASGGRLDFNLSLFTGCTLEDYDVAEVKAVALPANDSHPAHQL